MDDLRNMDVHDGDLLLTLLGEWAGREDELLDRRLEVSPASARPSPAC